MHLGGAKHAVEAPNAPATWELGTECTWEVPNDNREAPNPPGRRQMYLVGTKRTREAPNAPAAKST